jgi:predicted ATPase
VAKADIELKPLTVLMGPNNTGKTYISTLLLIADNIIKSLYFYHFIPKIIRDTPNASDFVKQNLEEGFVRLYSASNLGELVKRDADSGVVNIQFKQLMDMLVTAILM